MKNFRITGIVLAIVIIFVVIPVLMTSWVVINPGERGVLVRLGEVQTTYGTGFYFKFPYIDSVKILTVQTQKEEMEVDAASRDLQQLTTKVALNYHINPNQVAELYENIGTDYVRRIIQPAIEESTKAAIAKFTAEEAITKRPDVKSELRSQLQERLQKNYLSLDDISIVNFRFSPEFDEAIEAKQTAEQNALKAQNDLRRIQVEAQQVVEKAKAEAESIRIQGEALKENQELVELKAVEKWNGVLPQYLLGNTVPFVNLN
ncbi:prohibitin family protein [Candidatus Peregrinibacteria bacterium]|nr:prohibitin family protein [Candidatus Peregrinibacteria bacterium]